MQPTMTPLTLNTILPGNRLVKSLRLYIDCLRRRGLPDYDRCVLGSIIRHETLQCSPRRCAFNFHPSHWISR